MSAYGTKSLKSFSVPLRVVLIVFVVMFSFYICTICINQISVGLKPRSMLVTTKLKKNYCEKYAIPPEDVPYVHFPQPKTYSRGECSCVPVRYFVIISLQRSGSGWFETLLNSHPNISSNGEIFNVWSRRANISSILRTLDTVYNLDWLSSAAKNECISAFGFKWMLNQGILDHHVEIIDYMEMKGVSIIFLFRRNLLRRLISVLANDYDRHARQLNGTHKSHVHSKEEAEVLARFKPTINVEVLLSNLSHAESVVADCLQIFSNTRHMLLYYEDIINNDDNLSVVQEFLRVPRRKLVSHQVKIHTRPTSELVKNWEAVFERLNGTKYEQFIQNVDYAR